MRVLQIEKPAINSTTGLHDEFRKDFGANCKMSLAPLSSSHEIQMVTNWLFEADSDCFNAVHKIVRPSLMPVPELAKWNFMIKMDPFIPVSKVRISPVQEDIFSLHQDCEENHLIIRAVFNPKLSKNQGLYSNAIRLACLYSFSHLKAIQVWMEAPSFQKNLIHLLMETGFQIKSEFRSQAYPITKMAMSLKEFKNREFFSL